MTELMDRALDDWRGQLFTGARTAVKFAPTPVSDEELTAAWDLAKWGPTAANMQPLRVLYVRTPEGKARLIPHLAEGNRAKSESAPVVAVLAVDTRFHEHVPTVRPFAPEMQGFLESNPDARTGLASVSAPMQAGYFVLALRAAGLDAGPMAGFDKAGVDAEFFGDGRWQSLLVVNIGHATEDGFMDRQARLDHAHVLAWA